MKKTTKTVKPKTVKQMSEESRTRVERATVRLVDKGGQGVLVPGEFIITATHCIDWSGTGGMVLGDVYPAEIETASGAKFRLGVIACEPVSDMAVLGELDYQQCPDDAEAFEQWREQVEPVPLSTRQLGVGQSCPVFIFTDKREWLAGSVTRYGIPGQLAGSSVSPRSWTVTLLSASPTSSDAVTISVFQTCPCSPLKSSSLAPNSAASSSPRLSALWNHEVMSLR